MFLRFSSMQIDKKQNKKNDLSVTGDLFIYLFIYISYLPRINLFSATSIVINEGPAKIKKEKETYNNQKINAK